MNDRIFTPLLGFVLGFVSWESFQSIIYSLIIAFIGGIVAWLAKFLCDTLYKIFKNRKSNNEKTIG
jgi:phosphate/sulfate permease